MLDLHFVTRGLAVGASFPMASAARLAVEHGISRVVDVRVEDCDDEAELRRHGIRLLHLPTQDTCAVSQPRIRDGVAFVLEGLERGEGVLIHCQHGIGRSALLALCVLVARGDAPLAAIERAKRARDVVSPSPEQIRAFLTYCAELKATGATWEVPSFRDIVAVAWTHLAGP